MIEPTGAVFAAGLPRDGPLHDRRLTRGWAKTIVQRMRVRGFSARDRLAAACALLALAVVLLGSTGGLTADPGAEGEPCVGCTGCESGRCGEGGEDPLTSHHHCCITCCFSHAPLALAIECSTQIPAIVGPMSVGPTVALVGRCPDTPYRPPRA